MAIPEEQLVTWSHVGAGVGSADTYAAIRRVLQDRHAPYANQNSTIFLQGSYGNDTNVWAESDVDVVIRLDSVFSYDIDALPLPNRANFINAYPQPAYGIENFRPQVLAWLRDQFPGDVTEGAKAISIAANGNRRSADVLISQMHYRYTAWGGFMGEQTVEGVRFLARNGEYIANYPLLHSAALTARHQLSQGWLKPVIRIVKNMRNRMADEGRIVAGLAPSYFIEGLLYNVPLDQFGLNYSTTVRNCIRWLWQADRATFRCVNGQHMLLGNNSPTSWPVVNCGTFLLALVNFWDEWGQG